LPLNSLFDSHFLLYKQSSATVQNAEVVHSSLSKHICLAWQMSNCIVIILGLLLKVGIFEHI